MGWSGNVIKNDIVEIANYQGHERAKSQCRNGRVSLVGAGPGAADLLTIKALRCIEQADIILFDRQVSDEVCALFPANTPALYVGKIKNLHSIPQDKLNELLVIKAQQGLNVCRLKGGDAFVFGRGGEEMLTLKKAGIDVEVIPGITAASGATTYSGIPLTHRGVSQGCTFITGHAEKDLNINWQSLAGLKHTLVFYMGLSPSADISNNLMAADMDENTPVAIIENGSCQNQRLVRGKLMDLADLVARESVVSPALIVVGEVVNLADQLQWFESELSKKEQQLRAWY